MTSRTKFLFGFFFTGIILVAIFSFFPASFQGFQQYFSGNVSLDSASQGEKPAFDSQNFLSSLKKRDPLALAEILKNISEKGKEQFFSDVASFSRIDNLTSQEFSSGLFFSFFASKKTDLLHPYYGFVSSMGELVYGVSPKGKVVSFVQKTGTSEMLVQNMGPFPWSVKDAWRESVTGEVLSVSAPSGSERVEVGEMMLFVGGLPKNSVIENLDRGFVVEME